MHHDPHRDSRRRHPHGSSRARGHPRFYPSGRDAGGHPRRPAGTLHARSSGHGEAPLRRATRQCMRVVRNPLVSIRAPPRRATRPWRRSVNHDHISIRAPLRRATSGESAPPCGERYTGDLFQSAPPCGERPKEAADKVSHEAFQSAPPCGERPFAVLTDCDRRQAHVFQSAPPCGERPSCIASFDGRMFQSAPPCGERRRLSEQNSSCFNPRPPAESDQPSIRARLTRPFQSAPPCGERPADWRFVLRKLVSIRAPLRRATASYASSRLPERMFQSAPPCGERRHRQTATKVSIRAPLRRATTCAEAVYVRLRRVSIRAPLRRATGRNGCLRLDGVSIRPHCCRSRCRCFNPRPPAESDPLRFRRRGLRRLVVSIRAPLRRATSVGCGLP